MGATSTFWLAPPLSWNRVMLSWIVEAFSGFKEYRVGKVAKGRPRHPLLGLLMILFLSRVAGCRGWDASADARPFRSTAALPALMGQAAQRRHAAAHGRGLRPRRCP